MTRNKLFLLLVNQQVIVIKMSYAKYVVNLVTGMRERERERGKKPTQFLCHPDLVIFKSLKSNDFI